MANQQTQQGKQMQGKQNRDRQTLLGVVERLLAGAAVAGAAVYVLINALYVEFYDDFGVRPEDVGWDRLAVLGRAAWVALFVIAMAGLTAYLYPAMSIILSRLGLTSEEEASAENGRLWTWARRRRWMASVAIAIVVLIFLYSFYRFELRIESEARRVREGQNVNGLGWVVPFIDVRATRAWVTWLGDEEKRPVALGYPYLMYLGRSQDIAVFLACGRTTIIVPADDVAIHLLNTAESEQQRKEFENVC